MIRIAQLIRFAVIVGTALSVTLAKEPGDPIPADAKLVALNKHRPVLEVVTKYYPDATSILFGQKLHFEDSTQLHIARAITKVAAGGKPPLVEVRGPKEEGGVWCDIVLLGGSSNAYARAEGAVEREHFVEHKIYQDLLGIDHHLHVTLRVPKGKRSMEFVTEFKSLIRSYSHDFVTDK